MSIAINSKNTMVRQVISIVVQLIAIIIIARELGVNNNGIYAIAILLPNILRTLLSMSINSSIIYFANNSLFTKDEIFTNSFLLLVAIILIGLSLGYVIINFFTIVFFPNISKDILLLSVWIFPFSLLCSYLLSFIIAKENFKIFNIISLCNPILFLCIITILYFLDSIDVQNTILSHLVSIIFSSFIIFFYVFKEGFAINLKSLKQEKMIKIYSYGFRSHISNIITFVNYRADIFLLNIFSSLTSVGLYQIAVQIVERLWIISSATNTVLFPRLVIINHENDKKFEIISKSFKIIILLTFILSLFLMIFGYIFINLFFGIKYIESYFIILALIPGVIMGSGSMVLANAIAAKGKPELNAYTSFISMILNIMLNLILIPIYGYMGAAIATSIAYIVNAIMRIALYRKVEKEFKLIRLTYKVDDIYYLIHTIKRLCKLDKGNI